jgi:hypothetical protein
MNAVKHIGIANNQRSIVFYRPPEFKFTTEADLNMESSGRENPLAGRTEALRRAHPS